jgi:hypothetical protein
MPKAVRIAELNQEDRTIQSSYDASSRCCFRLAPFGSKIGNAGINRDYAQDLIYFPPGSHRKTRSWHSACAAEQVTRLARSKLRRLEEGRRSTRSNPRRRLLRRVFILIAPMTNRREYSPLTREADYFRMVRLTSWRAGF